MNRALHKMSDEERAEKIRQDKILLFRPDMHQEPEPPARRAPQGASFAYLAVIYAAIIAIVVAWVIVERAL